LLGRSSYSHFTAITTRWADNDVYGHVNNIVYYGWFDTAVNGWLLEVGLLDIVSGDPIGLVVETGCRYASSIAYPQDVDIGLAIERIGKSSVHYRLGVFAKGAQGAAAEGRFVHVYVDRDTRRPVDLPASWRGLMEGLKLRVADV
jgi:acyl-CoA thioester hydrolase